MSSDAGKRANPYNGMTDAEVLERSRDALERAKVAPVGSMERLAAFAAFDLSQAELSRRAMLYALARIHELESENGKVE